MKAGMRGSRAPLYATITVFVAGFWIPSAFASRDTQEVKLNATEFKFDPSNPSVSTGKVTFIVKNVGSYPHGLAIEGRKDTIPKINPGQTARITVSLAKGPAVFYCPLEGHRERGMEGKIVVGTVTKGSAAKKEKPTEGNGSYGY